MGLLKEKIEYYRASLGTGEGIFEFLVSSFFFGFLIVKFSGPVYDKILSLMPSGGHIFFYEYLGYLIFGILSIPFSIIATWLLTEIYKKLFPRRVR